MKTVSIKNGMVPSSPYAYLSTKGTINVFDTTGGMGAKYFERQSLYVKTAPISVARLPKITSSCIAPIMILETMHPIVRPGTAANVNAGNTVKASESLI